MVSSLLIIQEFVEYVKILQFLKYMYVCVCVCVCIYIYNDFKKIILSFIFNNNVYILCVQF